MKYASSIRFGGQLIDAVDCDYQDYKRLGLLCPECKDPVFLRAEGTRQQNGKEVKIGAHFCHFAEKNPEQAKVCEKRVGGYTQADIDKAVAKARGQRLKLLQRWFWSVLSENPQFKKGRQIGEELGWYEPLGDTPSELDVLWKQTANESLEEDTEEIVSALKQDGAKQSIENIVSSMAEWARRVIDGGEDLIWMQIQGKIHFLLISRLDIRQHQCICLEVVEFLLSRKQRHLLKDLILSVNGLGEMIYELPDSWAQSVAVDCKASTKIDLYLLLDIICSVPWADEFARLSAESKEPIAP